VFILTKIMANIVLNRFAFNKLKSSLRLNKSLLLRKNAEQSKGWTRNSSDYAGYREFNYEPNRPHIQRLMHFYAGTMWCYMYWMYRHNWRELVGEHVWPQRSEWSDEHLGIPPDDYD